MTVISGSAHSIAFSLKSLLQTSADSREVRFQEAKTFYTRPPSSSVLHRIRDFFKPAEKLQAREQKFAAVRERINEVLQTPYFDDRGNLRFNTIDRGKLTDQQAAQFTRAIPLSEVYETAGVAQTGPLTVGDLRKLDAAATHLLNEARKPEGTTPGKLDYAATAPLSEARKPEGTTPA